MQKAIRVYKSGITSTIIYTIIITLLLGTVSFVSIVNSAINGFTHDCVTFDASAEKVARIVEQDFAQRQKIMKLYGEVLRAKNVWANNTVMAQLASFENKGEMQNVAYIDTEGNLSAITKRKFEGFESHLIADSFKPGDNSVHIMAGQNDMVVYAMPLLVGSESKGYLIGLENARTSTSLFGEGLDLNTSVLYVLDENNKVVTYTGGEGYNFSYDQIAKDSFFSKDREFLDMFQYLEFRKGTSYIWYEKPISAVNQQWKLVVGKRVAISEESQYAVENVIKLVAFIMCIFFALNILIIISKGMSNKKLSNMAYVDLVIQWPNWNKFIIDANKILSKSGNRRYAMIAFDVHKFRIINDMDGNKKGEEILRKITNVATEKIRKRELFTRFATDEFAILFQYTNQEELINRIYMLDEELKAKIPVNRIAFSYGIYYITDRKMPIQRMYTYASIAKDTIKSNHDIFIGVFTNDLRDGLVREKELEGCMEAALENREFHIYLQPKYSADGKKVGGAEALVRWISPTMGFISPGAFIPLFEKNGFIIHLDDYMLKEVCAYQKKWMDAGNELVTISVNVSRAHLLDPLLVESVITTIESFRLPYDCIELELTESAFFEDKKVLLQTVKRLQEAGFLISMDDFGTGYSSLNSLKDLPLDIIKLDGEFFQYTDNYERSEIVIQDTINLAKHLNMKIVAEGIETEEQVTLLRSMGCDFIQGYYFAKPMPVNEFEELMGYHKTGEIDALVPNLDRNE